MGEISFLKKLGRPEVTTSMLLGALSGYADPRGKISTLSKKGFLTPIKQGVYIVSSDFSQRPFSKAILANLIYGPSYISLETALSHYGFIPEQVFATTSICIGRGRSISTPVGEFSYHHIKEDIYFIGVKLFEVFEGEFCQFATPEKALLDFVHIRESKGNFKSSGEYFDYMQESYRLDLDAIEREISLKKLHSFADQYPFQHVHWFALELIRRLLK